MAVLTKDFYIREDVIAISRELLGKYLITQSGKEFTSGIITETEAYCGVTDKASHAYNHRRTKRTEVMYAEGGVAYVYFCYGMHHLFNVVTNQADIPHAILIRAIYPIDGIKTILERRGSNKINTQLTKGPGKVTQALGINAQHNHADLRGNKIWIEDRGVKIHAIDINIGKRIGVDYAEEDALLAYRFWMDLPL